MTGKEPCLKLERRLPRREFKIVVLSSMMDHEHWHWSNRMRNMVIMKEPVSMRLPVSMFTADFANERAEWSSSDA